MLLVRRTNCAAESNRLRIIRTAGFVAMPLRFDDLLKKKYNEIVTEKLAIIKKHLIISYPLLLSLLELPKIIRICVSRAK